MRKLRSALVVLSVVTLLGLGLGVIPNPLHQVLAGARVAQATHSQAAGSQGQAPLGSSPTSQAPNAPNGGTLTVVALTAGGQHLRSNLLADLGKASLPGPGHALGHGSALIGSDQLEFQFAAQGDPFDAHGNAFFILPGFINSRGPVDCLDVVGTTAYLSGPLARQVIPGFNRWFLYVEDNDVADQESGTPDRIGLLISTGLTLPDCNNTAIQDIAVSTAFTFSKGKVEADQKR